MRASLAPPSTAVLIPRPQQTSLRYSPKCVEQECSELRVYLILRSSLKELQQIVHLVIRSPNPELMLHLLRKKAGTAARLEKGAA
jgi:hypothetical protein